jgi:tetratricopeptide (TPR) repeat protein
MKPISKGARIDEFITITPEEIPTHLKRGKAYLAAGRREEALKEFGSILKVAPGNMETRVWMQKARQAMAKPEEAPLAEREKPEYCVYMVMGVVSYRLCTSDYNCLSCEFEKQMEARIAAGEAEVIEALERYKSLPGKQKFCRYALKGNVSYRLCSRVIDCATCEFNQMIEDAFQQQLIQRQEALHNKEQGWWWHYWDLNSMSQNKGEEVIKHGSRTH